MSLLNQTTDGSTHRDHIIIRMRREDNHTLREWFCTLRTISIVGIRFTTRPASNSVLQIIKYLNVHIVCRTIQCQQFTQTVFIIVLISQFQNRFFGKQTQPNDSTTNQLIVPFAACYQPRTLNTSKMGSSRQIDAYRCVLMHLQIRSRQCVRNLVFYSLFDNIGLFFAPCQQEYLTCFHN